MAVMTTMRIWRAKRRRRRLLQQVIPEEEVDELDLPTDVRSSKYINRPSFSLPLMTNNFRRFNARFGSQRSIARCLMTIEIG